MGHSGMGTAHPDQSRALASASAGLCDDVRGPRVNQASKAGQSSARASESGRPSASKGGVKVLSVVSETFGVLKLYDKLSGGHIACGAVTRAADAKRTD